MDEHTVYMDVNVLPSLTTMFGTTSDLVIAVMTINRYHLIKGNVSTKKNYSISVDTACHEFRQFVIFEPLVTAFEA